MTAPAHPPVTAILFDKDGTLFDFQATWAAWAAAFLQDLAAGDAARQARLLEVTGLRLDPPRFASDSPVIAGTAQEVLDLLLVALPEADPGALYAHMNESVSQARAVPAAPLAELMARLSDAGLKLGVVTNDSESAARAHLDQAGITQAFAAVIGFDSGWGAKPEPGQLLGFCDRFGLAPESVVMVGDSLHDLHAAKAAGTRAVAVLTGVAEAETLAPAAEAVLPHIGHLPDWLALPPLR